MASPLLLLAQAATTEVIAAPADPVHPARMILFWLLAFGAVAGALLTITRRSAVVASMWLVGTLMCLAGLFVSLYAHFIGVIQVLVYAGAIMVLFVFVIMILNKEEDEPVTTRTLPLKAAAVAILGGTIGFFCIDLWALRTRVLDLPWKAGEAEVFGTTRGVGQVLFTDYLFAFEAVSLVLLIAVIGGVVLARPFKRREMDAAHGMGRGPAGGPR